MKTDVDFKITGKRQTEREITLSQGKKKIFPTHTF